MTQIKINDHFLFAKIEMTVVLLASLVGACVCVQEAIVTEILVSSCVLKSKNLLICVNLTVQGPGVLQLQYVSF